jgi:hypothetical protein
MRESLTQKGIGLGGRAGPCCLALPMKPRAVLVWHALSDVEGGGLLADGQT